MQVIEKERRNKMLIVKELDLCTICLLALRGPGEDDNGLFYIF